MKKQLKDKKKILIFKTRIPIPKPVKPHSSKKGDKGYDRNKIKEMDRKEEKKPLHLKNPVYNRIKRR